MLRKRLKFTPVDPETGPHPIAKLPAELLGAIFSFAEIKEEYESLGFVCRRWCHASLSFGRKNPTGLMARAAECQMIDVMKYIKSLHVKWWAVFTLSCSVKNQGVVAMQWVIDNASITGEMLKTSKFGNWRSVIRNAAAYGNLAALRYLQEYYERMLGFPMYGPEQRPDLVVPNVFHPRNSVDTIMAILNFAQQWRLEHIYNQRPRMDYTWVFLTFRNITKHFRQSDGVRFSRYIMEHIEAANSSTFLKRCEFHAFRGAVDNGHIGVVQYLEERGLDIHMHADIGAIWAAATGQMGILEHFMERGLRIRGNNVLSRTARNGHLEMVKFLVSKGINDHTHDIALRAAARYGHLEMVKYFIDLGADPHADDENALRKAAQFEKWAVVKYLIVEQGARADFGQDKAMYTAVRRNQLNLLKFLVEIAGANVHARNERALRMATKRRRRNIVKYLMEHGADASVLGSRV